MRSLHSQEKCYIRFKNKSGRTVDIVWINFTGQYVKYNMLRPDQFLDIITFKTHPWVALDSVSKDPMLIHRQFRFLPETVAQHIIPPMQPRVINRRAIAVVFITLPLYSLRYKCLLDIRDMLHEEKDVDTLEITSGLKNELKELIRRKAVALP